MVASDAKSPAVAAVAVEAVVAAAEESAPVLNGRLVS